MSCAVWALRITGGVAVSGCLRRGSIGWSFKTAIRSLDPTWASLGLLAMSAARLLAAYTCLQVSVTIRRAYSELVLAIALVTRFAGYLLGIPGVILYVRHGFGVKNGAYDKARAK